MDRKLKLKIKRRLRTKRSVRRNVTGTDLKPRISVFKSGKHTYAQVISDESSKTIAAASTTQKAICDKASSLPNEEGEYKSTSTKSRLAARAVGLAIADQLKSAGVQQAVFDRNGYRYHGRVKSLADGIREGGFNI